MDPAGALTLADVLIRYPAIGMLVLIGLLGLRDGRGSRTVLLASVTCLSCAAVLLSSAPAGLLLPFPVHVVLRLIDTTAIPLAWWLGLALFDDDFRPGRVEWGGMILLVLLLAVWRLATLGLTTFAPAALDPVIDLISLSMIVHVVWKAFAGRAEDLVERRRKVRFWFALSIACGTLMTVLADNLFRGPESEIANFVLAVVVGGLALWGGMWLLQLEPLHLRFEQPAERAPPEPSVDPRDAATYKRLLHLMETERAYLEPGLTIGALAARVGVPEHQLRALINGALGHRNFSGFLNGYRLAHAKAVLSDPEQARLPILTIALDSGYASLAPFNRAFRAAEGVTPSEFRAARLTET